MSRSKYGNVKTHVDGIGFDSAKEAKRYVELRMLERAGLIRDLELQPRFVLQPAYIHKRKKVQPILYVADFKYFDCEQGVTIVEDAKGFRNATYLLKRKMFLYLFKDYTFLET